jgi:membrane dipeptidase
MSQQDVVGRLMILAGLASALAGTSWADDPGAVSERARAVHESGMLFDGHNDLPWLLRSEGDSALLKFDLSKRLATGQTDVPRLREGGVKAQFWSVYIPSEHPNPTKTVVEQIDLVNRLIAKYPRDLELALTAADVERIVRAGKIASLIGIEGGVAIDDSLAQLRAFHKLGARYMTLTHNATLSWADAANDKHKHGGLTPFGETIVGEMNRLGMLVDISHVSAETMADALRVSKAPVIASHSSAFALCPSPRNVPDDVLKAVRANGGVVMVNFYSGFIVPGFAEKIRKVNEEIRKKHANRPERAKAFADWLESDDGAIRGTIKDVANHIDHIVKVAGIDHVGIGSDFDGIQSWPVGLEDVSCFPKLTEELLRRGYSETDVHKILGANVLRAFREAEAVAKQLQATTPQAVDEIKVEKPHED